MTELLIAAVSGAGLTIGVAVIVLVISLKLSTSNGERESARVQVATLTADNKAKDAAIAALTGNLKTANSRVEALDAENRKLRAAQPVGGSFDRLFPPEATAGADSGGGQDAVPGSKNGSAATAPDPTGPDGLLKPGE